MRRILLWIRSLRWVIFRVDIDNRMKEITNDYRVQGVTIGDNTILYNVNIDRVYPFLITIGNNCIITNCTILAHDDSSILHNGKVKIGQVKIGNNCFIGYNAIILPNIEIGNNSIVGAGAVVTKDVPPNSVIAGNPARIISSTNERQESIDNKWVIGNGIPIFKTSKDLANLKKSAMACLIENK